jgi:hypothetical protein
MLVFALHYVVPARLPLNANLPVYAGALPPERFDFKPALLRFHKKLFHFFLLPLDPANGVPRFPVGETHLLSQLTDALARYPNAPGNLGLGDAIPRQHGADQFRLSVNQGKSVPLKPASV